MFEKEFQEWFERNKKWLYSSDHMQAAYHAWCAGIQQQNAAQHSLHADGFAELEASGKCSKCGNEIYFKISQSAAGKA
jgi:hypothetical protein